MDKGGGVCVCVYLYSEIVLIHKKERKFAICNNMDGAGGYFALWKKSDQGKWILNVITGMWNLKYKINWWI